MSFYHECPAFPLISILHSPHSHHLLLSPLLTDLTLTVHSFSPYHLNLSSTRVLLSRPPQHIPSPLCIQMLPPTSYPRLHLPVFLGLRIHNGSNEICWLEQHSLSLSHITHHIPPLALPMFLSHSLGYWVVWRGCLAGSPHIPISVCSVAGVSTRAPSSIYFPDCLDVLTSLCIYISCTKFNSIPCLMYHELEFDSNRVDWFVLHTLLYYDLLSNTACTTLSDPAHQPPHTTSIRPLLKRKNTPCLEVKRRQSHASRRVRIFAFEPDRKHRPEYRTPKILLTRDRHVTVPCPT